MLGFNEFNLHTVTQKAAPWPQSEPGRNWTDDDDRCACAWLQQQGVLVGTHVAAEAVQTVKNFVALARRGYFDGLFVHRVVPNFVIQDGDPTGTGSGGPGYTIRCEYNHLRYDAGAVGMALSGKDTGGSQWFITHSPQPHLNGRYTIFAHVVRGMDVVGRIVQGDRILKVELK